MNPTVHTQVTRHTDTEAPTFHFEYRAQQWRTQDFRMRWRGEPRGVQCGARRLFCIFLS